MKMKSMLMGMLALSCACVFGGEAVVAQKLQTCDFLLNKDFKKNAKYYLCLFSASWCGPCRREMPRLAKTYVDTLKADPDIEFIHFSRDQNDEKALAWAKEHDVKFPVVKPKGGNPLDLHSRGIPHLFIVNADGKLLAEGHPASLFTDEKLRALKAGEMTVPETPTDKTQKAITKLFPGWVLDTEVTHELCGFHASHRGQTNVVFIHPKSMETPAVISRTLTLSDKNPCLFLKVASWNEDADYLLAVRVNGKDALPTRLITTPDFAPWEDIVVPLSAWRGSEAKIEVVLTANNWWYENPMLTRLEIAEGKGDMSIVEGKVTVDGYKWSYRAQNGEATIIAENDGQFSCAVTPCPIGDISIPATLGGAKVTRIGRCAFKDCSGLTSVTIPEGVTHVGRDAFRDCTGLQSAKIPSSVQVIEWDAFGGCNALKSLTLPAGLTNIERGAFHWCCGPTSVMIPESVTHIGQDAFAWCRALTSVTIPLHVTDIGWATFRGCNALTSVTIPASVTNINFTAFCDTGALTSFRVDEGNQSYKSENGLLLTKDGTTLVRGVNGDVKIPASVTAIGPCAFEGSVALRPVVIPSGVKSIDHHAFKNCRGLTAVSISEGVTSIGEYAFHGCNSLKSVTIPSTVTSIGREAFVYCRMTSVKIPAGVTIIRNSTFTGSGLTSVTIPPDVKIIERGAFSFCGDLMSITFPEGLTSIGSDAFYNCGKLMAVTIPSSVTRIEHRAFYGCSGLKSLTIPAALTNNIDCAAFDGCSKLKSVNVVMDGETESMSFDEFSKQLMQERPRLLGRSLRARRLLRQQQVQSVVAKQQSGQSAIETQREAQAETETTQREVERAEQRQQLQAIQEELKRLRKEKAAAGMTSPALNETRSLLGGPGRPGLANAGLLRRANRPQSTNATASVVAQAERSTEMTRKAAVVGYTWSYRVDNGEAEIVADEKLRCAVSPSPTGHIAIPAMLGGAKVTSVGKQAFSGCGGLLSVEISENVRSIGHAAFYECGKLTSVTIPKGVQSIGGEAFYDCGGLMSITMCGERPEAPNDVFKGCRNLKAIHVPSNCKSWAGMKEWQGIPLVFDAKAE